MNISILMRKVLALHFLQIVTVNDDNKRLTLCHPSFQVKHALELHEISELCHDIDCISFRPLWLLRPSPHIF
jgi:hypothetical protein